jgi:hypothetical protein
MRVPLAGHGFTYVDAISKAVLLSLDHLAWTITVLYFTICLTNGRSTSTTVMSTQSDARMFTFLYILGLYHILSYLIQGTHEIPSYNIPSPLNQMVKKK